VPARTRVRGRLRQPRSLRSRVTVVASVAIAAAVTGAFVLLYLLQVHSVRRTVDQQLRTYTTQIAQLGQASPATGWPHPLPDSALDPTTQAQVIADDGTVLSATRGLSGVPATFALPAGSSTPVRLKGAAGVIPAEVRVVAVRQRIGGRPVTIVAGTGTGILSSFTSAFTYELIVGFPVILLAAAAAVWLLVGRALGPVEQIRRAVTDITSADLSRRVPEPGTADEIGRLAHTMNRMLTRLEDSARRQHRFVADASHELRSPLAAIRTTLEVGLAHPDRVPWPSIAARAVQQGERLEALIQQLLLLARTDGPTAAGRARPVDVDELLRAVRRETPAGKVSLDLDLHAGGAGMVPGNPDHLVRVFRNVLDNAVHHAAGSVTITSCSTSTTLEVRIVDDGPGVPRGDRERIFDRFVRLDASRDRASGGSGLGLAIAREIVTAHRGRISHVDGPRPGGHVLIVLPRLGGAAATDKEHQSD